MAKVPTSLRCNLIGSARILALAHEMLPSKVSRRNIKLASRESDSFKEFIAIKQDSKDGRFHVVLQSPGRSI